MSAVKNGVAPASGADGVGYGSPFFGVSLVHTSDTVVTVTPNTDLPFDGKGRVLMYDTSEVGKWFTISATIAIDNTTEGPTANGRRNGLTIENNLPYPIYLYGKADGTVCGQYLGTGEDPTSYFPTDYTYVSPCMGAVCSDGTADWIPFWQLGNTFWFDSHFSENGLDLLYRGTSTSVVAIDASTVIPEEAVVGFAWFRAWNTITSRTVALYHDAAGAKLFFSAYTSSTQLVVPAMLTLPCRAPATWLYYGWNDVPNTGLYFSVLGFRMRY